MPSSYVVVAGNGIGGAIAMAGTLKRIGLIELEALIKRTRRQLALGRISEINATFIVERLLEVEKRIEQMEEFDEQGNPEETIK
jgi:hypothetical protein